MVVAFTADGRTFDENFLDGTPWRREWLAQPLADLQASRFARFTDNFIRVNCTPGTVAWQDDAGWAAVAAKLGHLMGLEPSACLLGLACDVGHLPVRDNAADLITGIAATGNLDDDHTAPQRHGAPGSPPGAPSWCGGSGSADQRRGLHQLQGEGGDEQGVEADQGQGEADRRALHGEPPGGGA
ncbi:MAG: hypothetical protein WDA75_25315 [Candidatus Latescibacterota bacterium]|jgi:hypothetical protein